MEENKPAAVIHLDQDTHTVRVGFNPGQVKSLAFGLMLLEGAKREVEKASRQEEIAVLQRVRAEAQMEQQIVNEIQLGKA